MVSKLVVFGVAWSMDGCLGSQAERCGSTSTLGTPSFLAATSKVVTPHITPHRTMRDIEETGEAQVTFTKSGITTVWLAEDNLTILQLAEKEGLKPLYGCRSAMCGSCEVKIVKGQVYGVEGDKPQGILICQSRPATTEIEIEL